MPYYMHELNPDYNPATRILRNMTTSELQAVLNEDELIKKMVQDLHQVKNAELERNSLLEANRILAESNLAQEPMLQALRITVSEQREQISSLKSSLEEKKLKLDELTRQMSLDTTLALLQAAAAEAEEESEAVSENFLSGELDVEAFLESYLDKRKKTHLRRVKAEKMTEVLNKAPISRNARQNAPYPTDNSQFYRAPYPSVPFPFYQNT